MVELLTIHGMSIADVAESLSRSKGWVCMRCNLLDAMSDGVERILFRGTFPVYSYMYTLRPFRRMNCVTRARLEQMRPAVTGKQLSVRNIDLLADGYFRGPDSLRGGDRRGQAEFGRSTR